MQKRLLLIFLIILIPSVYSLSLYPSKDNNLISLNEADLKEVRYSNNILELVLESNSNLKIDGIIVNINNNDNIIINKELSPYSTNIYQINTKETPNIINIQFFNDINHNRNVINQVITYRITGNEQPIINQPQQIVIQEQQLQQQFNQRPSYVSYSSYSKLDDNKNIIYFTKDLINSNQISTNQQGNTEFQANYQPYGKVFKEEGKESYKFSNKELDSSNLYYFGARYYDPSAGRFTQIDPFFKSSESSYMYANNNPIKYIDPTGKEVKIEAHNFEGVSPEEVGSYGQALFDFLGLPEVEAVLGFNPQTSKESFSFLLTVIEDEDKNKQAQYKSTTDTIEIDVNFLFNYPFEAGFVALHEIIHNVAYRKNIFPTMNEIHDKYGYKTLELPRDQAFRYLEEDVLSEERAWNFQLKLVDAMKNSGRIDEDQFNYLKDLFTKSKLLEVDRNLQTLNSAREQVGLTRVISPSEIQLGPPSRSRN